MDSIWTRSEKFPSFSRLQGDKKTDVLIVGGGMAGILCAYFLQQKGIDYVLAEGRTIGSGVSKNTTAKILHSVFCTHEWYDDFLYQK